MKKLGILGIVLIILSVIFVPNTQTVNLFFFIPGVLITLTVHIYIVLKRER